MEILLTILLLTIVLVFAVKATIKTIKWINDDSDSILERHKPYLKDKIDELNLQFVMCYIPSERREKENSFSKNTHFYWVASDFMMPIKVYFIVIICFDNDIKKEVWVKVLG